MTRVYLLLAFLCSQCLAAEPETFEYKFTADDLAQFFDFEENISVEKVDAGLKQSVKTNGPRVTSTLSSRFSLEGDFDIEVEFTDLELKTQDLPTGISLQVHLGDEREHYARFIRSFYKGEHKVENEVSRNDQNGNRQYDGTKVDAVMTEGKFRLVRSGHQLVFMHADPGGQYHFGTKQFLDAASPLNGVRLVHICNGHSEASVAWKSLTIRADRLLYHPPGEHDEPHHLYVMDVVTGKVTEISEPIDGATRMSGLRWSKHGRIFFDVLNDTVNGSQIVSIKPDGTNLRRHGRGHLASVSPDGDYLAFADENGIYLSDLEDTFREPLHPQATGVAWAPNSERIAYQLGNTIFVRNMDSGEERNLLDDDQTRQIQRLQSHLAWSPDGTTIACRAKMSDNSEAVCLFDVQAGEFRVLAQRECLGPAVSWAPDGKSLLMSQKMIAENRHQMVFINLDAPGKIQPLANQALNYSFIEADWSPDGTKVVCSGKKTVRPIEWSEYVKSEKP